jgi:8-oxo-dGTP pyrophosphatase MutT (NUDIX family)
VAIVLARDPASQASTFLLTERAANLRSHAGQWALPGGRCEEGEPAIAAALRELEEELGLRLLPSEVLGQLDDYATRSGYLITPILAWAEGERGLRPNPHEVATVLHVPVDLLAETEAFDFIRIPESGQPVIRLRMNARYIHAPTAAILFQFRELLAGRVTRVSGLEQPVFAWR